MKRLIATIFILFISILIQATERNFICSDLGWVANTWLGPDSEPVSTNRNNKPGIIELQVNGKSSHIRWYRPWLEKEDQMDRKIECKEDEKPNIFDNIECASLTEQHISIRFSAKKGTGTFIQDYYLINNVWITHIECYESK